MPVVPTYQPTESLRPNYRQTVTTRASGEDFGASSGRGLQSAGQGVNQLSDAMRAVRELEDVAFAKEADNDFAAWVRERQYGENGYMTLEGRAAVEARTGFERDLAEAREQFGQDLSPGAKLAYSRASTSRMNASLDSAIVHQARQRKAWFSDVTDKRLKTFAEDALAGYSNPQAVAKNIAAGQAELRQQAELFGWDADALSAREMDYISGVHKNVAMRIAQADPVAADRYRRDHEKSLTGSDRYELENALGTAVREAQAISEADAILSGTRNLPGNAEGRGGSAAGEAGPSGPTKSRAFLLERMVAKGRSEDVTGFDETFAANLAAMIQDAPPGIAEGLGILSGYRSEERQQGLWEEALREHGSPEAARKWVAPPGSSYHNHGQAADISYNGRSLQHAPQEVMDWVHENAGKYGLHFPMAHESWHIEPVGARSGTVAPRTANIAPRTLMPSYADIEDRLSRITDPRVRDLTRRRIYAVIEAHNKAASQAEKAAKDELWRHIEQGATPDQVPQQIRLAAGMNAVSAAWSYVESTATRGVSQDDESLVYSMRRYAAMKPDQFAQIDLNDYRSRLSPQTFKELTGLQTSALGDQKKAREDGLSVTAAFSQAQSALEGVGISTTGLDGRQRIEQAERIARFNNVLASQMAEFKQANDGRNPDQLDVQQMINRLLLPVVITAPSWSLNPFTGFSGTDTIDDQFLFETGTRDADAAVSIAVPFETIPTDVRTAIMNDLSTELGRIPLEDEVAKRYNEILRDQISGSPKP